eukprot:c8271_g1_i2.p1 GENE.c8271_g1_i2~~c8271_g1_i2.p1  ORF type:complete len:183 (+),score=58.26 c8271_g1_i2:406-954(+)
MFCCAAPTPVDPVEQMGIATLRKNKLTKTDRVFLDNLMTTKQMFVVTDPSVRDHPIVYASPMFCEFTGYSSEEIVGKNCRFLQGNYREQQIKNIDRVRAALTLTTKEPVSVCLYNFKKDGTPFINQFFMTPLVNSQEEPVFFVGIQQQVFELRDGQDDANAAYVFRNKQKEEAKSPKKSART